MKTQPKELLSQTKPHICDSISNPLRKVSSFIIFRRVFPKLKKIPLIIQDFKANVNTAKSIINYN